MTFIITFQDCTPEIRQRVTNLLTTNEFKKLWEAGKPVRKGVDFIVKFKFIGEEENEVD